MSAALTREQCMSGRDLPEKALQLAAEIGQLQAELVPIEQALGLNQGCEEVKTNIRSSDLPDRVGELIGRVQGLSGRLADVKAVVLNLKNSVG